MSELQKAARYLDENKLEILKEWTGEIRRQLKAISDKPAPVLEDHLLEILDFIGESLLGQEQEEPGLALDCAPLAVDKSSATHARQRTSVTAYDVEQVYWEYVCLRRIIIRNLHENGLNDIAVLEAVNNLIESSSRAAIAIFTETLSEVQQKLFGSLVHDIRTPLSTIDAIGQILTIKNESPQIVSQGETLLRATSRINGMLYEILQTVSIKAGQGFQMSFEKQNLIHNLSILNTSLKVIYGDKFSMSLPDHEPDIAIDAPALTRTLENLVSNAFKHGAADTDVLMTVEDKDDAVTISIHNEGEPISRLEQERIFDFMHRDKGRHRSNEGSWGMGLTLAKATALGHKGKVLVRSSAENGTRFTFVLPKGARSEGETATIKI